MWRWTFPSIFFFTFTILRCCNGQQFVVVAPNLFRTDVQENVFLQATGVSGSISVTIKITDFDTNAILTQHYGILNEQNNHHMLTFVQVPSEIVRHEENKHKYIYMEVNFGDQHIEKRAIMVSFQAGYIFIQTDKPIYRPEDTVQIRLFASSPSFKASDSNPIGLDIKNPHDVVIYHSDKKRPKRGILTDSYNLPRIVIEGKWTVIARYNHWPQNTFNTTFEVKKYVLPAFNVTLMPRKPHVDVTDTHLYVDITARYLYNEAVLGTAYVIYGVKNTDRTMRAPKVKKVDIRENGGTLTLTAEEITEACEANSGGNKPGCSLRALADSYVYLKVSVLTDSGGDLVEVEKSDIKIVNSPYVLAIKEMQNYFKPGFPFHFTIHVTYHDGTPAHKIPLKVNDNDMTSNHGTAKVSINMPNQIVRNSFTITTNQADLSKDRQATKEVTVDPYRPANSNSPNYLYIRQKNQKVEIRELTFEMSIESSRKSSIDKITYLIISKGKILEAKRIAVANQRITSVTTTVTTEMMPSFRIVAFYTLGDEVVSDSIKLEVSKNCVNVPEISTQDSSVIPRTPGSTLRLKIKGEPSATISLVAVDQAVYLLNKNRFNQEYILNEVESRDTGCTHGSGANAMGVFSDAGLLFAMRDGPSTDSRQDLKCPVSARRRRSAVLMEHQDQLLGQFEEKVLQRCCRDGLRRVLMPYTCLQRSNYIAEGPDCMKAFLKCCIMYKNKIESLLESDDNVLGRSKGTGSSYDTDPVENDALQGYNFDIDEIDLRDKFQETWLWMDLLVPAEAGLDGLGTVLQDMPIPHTITQWSIHAVSSSTKTGFCVAEPWTFVASKPFFVDLKLPFSVARNEQVEIKAVVYNNLDQDLDVTVVLQKTSDMCSVAFKRQHTQKVSVRRHSSFVVPYTIVPFKPGKIPIEVAAFVINQASDRIRKNLNVVVEGVQKTESNIVPLNPSDHPGNRQIVRGARPILKGVVPNSEPVTKIKFTGHMLADSIENSIQDNALASLIRMPGGCVEQNLASITFPLITTVYLERTKGWESVGVQRKIDAHQYIQKGYSNQLNFKRSDGSYPPYGGQGPSTWITAYVVKVFTMIYSLNTENFEIENICTSVHFLVRNKQSSDGSFTEANPVSNQYMTGGLRGSDSSATLTAFVTIALAEVRKANLDCSYKGSDPESALTRAISYLKGQLQRSPPPRPYTTAIISYALALASDGRFDPTSNLLTASSDGNYWRDDDSLFTLEATGYALLALVKMNKLTEAKKPFDYLSSHKNYGGGSGSTQSTMVVLHAMSEYLIMQPPPDKHRLTVALQMATRKEKFDFDVVSSYQSRSFNVPKDADMDVVAEGNGMGTVEVVTFYNQLPEEDVKSCETFDMQVTIKKSVVKPSPGTKHVFELSISVKALGPVDAISVVLDITLPTGFIVEHKELENLLNTVERYIDYYEFDDKLSDRSSLIIHMYKVSNTNPRLVILTLHQKFNVGLLQPSSVTVYEYYKKDAQRCTRQYTPPQDQVQLTTICRNNICQCAQDDCCVLWRGTDDSQGTKRKDHACKTLHHVFKVKVHNVSGDYYDKYDMEITAIIKLGVEAGVLASERRFFFSHSGCRKRCKLEIGSEYLIMGPESDRWTQDPITNKYMYILGKDTWVERWPTETECKAPDMKDKCDSLTKATQDLHMDGCPGKK